MVKFHLKPVVVKLNTAISQGGCRACQNEREMALLLSQMASVFLFHLDKVGSGPGHPQILRRGHIAATRRWPPFSQLMSLSAQKMEPIFLELGERYSEIVQFSSEVRTQSRLICVLGCRGGALQEEKLEHSPKLISMFF